MGWWSFYFLIKLAGHATDSLAFHWLPNLLLALFVMIPLQGLRRWVQQTIAIAVGVSLLYVEARLPPISRLIGEFQVLADFDWGYLLELAGRFVGVSDILVLLGLMLVYWLLAAKLRMSSFAVLGILLVPLMPMLSALPTSAGGTNAPTAGPSGNTGETAGTASSAPPEAQLERFYQAEAQRQVTLGAPGLDATPFDIVFLHICSVAWDDLDLYGLSNHPLLQRRDIGFEAFNTVASYSGPAAMRLARASCGQRPHEALYSPAEPECLLFEQLAEQGYELQLMTNWSDSKQVHDFIPRLRQLGGLDVPQRGFGDAPITMRTYDGEAQYSDDALLDQWRASRRQASQQPAALYYNTTSLHDGNRLIDRPRASSKSTYPDRIAQLFDELKAFIDALDSAGRPTVVVLVPEHGGAMRGDALQIPGMREIPTPAITMAPVGVYLAGDNRQRTPVRIDTPTSYFALGTLLARFLRDDPFRESAPPLTAYSDTLPATRHVAVHDGTAVMRTDNRFTRREISGNWVPLETGLGRASALLQRPPVPLSPTASITSPDTD